MSIRNYAPRRQRRGVSPFANGLQVGTMVAALFLQMSYPLLSDEATGEFTPNKYARDNGKVPIKYGQIIIIDESSMVSDAMLLEIKQLVSAGAKVIFMGDKAQLPPVGQEKDC